MDADLDSLLTVVFCTADDLLPSPAGNARRIVTDAEVVTLAVAQVLLGYHDSDRRFLASAERRLKHLFPQIPTQDAFHKRRARLEASIEWLIGVFASQSPGYHDDVLVLDSTPVETARSRETVKRAGDSALADAIGDAAGYGYCASHSRFFWGLRLYLVCTPAGMPILWALANPKLGEREVLAAMLEVAAALIANRQGLLLITDKGFASKPFERSLSEHGITLLRPSRKTEIPRAGEPMLKKVRQLIESVNDTLKGQLDLEQHGGRTNEGVAVRVAQRVLALTAAIWHNFQTGQPVTRSLTAYDH